jgi:hypothetical protein
MTGVGDFSEAGELISTPVMSAREIAQRYAPGFSGSES